MTRDPDVAALENAKNFFASLKLGGGMPFQARLAWISIICAFQHDYRPIKNVRAHKLNVGSSREPDWVTFESDPNMVFSSARNDSLQRLSVTLRAEAYANALAVQLEEQPLLDEEDEACLRYLKGFANQLTRFHREAWGILEPASQDMEQREAQAELVVKRVIKRP